MSYIRIILKNVSVKYHNGYHKLFYHLVNSCTKVQNSEQLCYIHATMTIYNVVPTSYITCQLK
uniref:Uncharacterized protein n=1 Tax=Arundo donax TaxID=35708 RepID=A0A0A8Z8Y9_ARUDO